MLKIVEMGQDFSIGFSFKIVGRPHVAWAYSSVNKSAKHFKVAGDTVV